MVRKKKEEKQEVYHVEVITKARVDDDGEWEYHVKWAGYDSDADSWEPQENVKQCNRLLASFWKHVGMDNEDYAIGYEVAATPDWISKEKRYFAQTFVKQSKRTSDKAASKGDGEWRQSKSVSESSEDESPSPDEGPSVKAPATNMRNRIASIVDTESESEVDDSLRKQAKVAPCSTATRAPIKALPKAPDAMKQPENPSATGGSSIIAPPKVAAIRTHQEQRANPLVKSMSISSKTVEAGSSLSTKQRIAAGIPPPRLGPKPLPPAPKTSLSSLSFRKIRPSVPSTVLNKDVAMSSISIVTPSIVTPTSPVVQPTAVTKDVDVAVSPVPMDFFDFTMDDTEPIDNSETFAAPIPPKSWEEINAEKFLQTIDIPALSAPLETAAVPDLSSEPSVEVRKALAIPKIPKKWKWSGELYISTSEPKSELLCSVIIADPSGTSNSSHINLLLSSLDSLQISKLYPIRDLSPLLRACGEPQYFSRLESNDSSEEVVIQGLEHHMTTEGLAAAIPLLLDGTEAAVLVIFPGSQKGLTTVLKVPAQLSGTPLLAVLLPFLVSSTSIAGWRSIKTISEFLAKPEDASPSNELSQQAILHQAMTLLGFPKTLLDFIQKSTTSRTYCIWPLPDQLSLELDTAMLQYVLKSTKAVLDKLEEDIRIIFISNQHLHILHTMPTFVTKRANLPETQFWTYGYSPSTTHKNWKLQEIYPLGGIVTFTPSALAEDLVGCHQLISQIIEHPLWHCYIIPEVLAVCHMLCTDGDPSLPSETCLSSILDLIDLGSISIMRMPKKCNQLAWASRMFHSRTSRDELEASLEVLKSHPPTSSMTTEQLVAFANNEVSKDLSIAQIQPAFMESYRRFVVIRAASEDTIPLDKDGLEWSPLALFSFKDDYFHA